MATTIEDDGDQTATLDTEHTLATLAGAGTRVLAVDVNALVAGDVVTLRIKTAARSGGTERTLYEATFTGPAGSPIVQSPPAVLATGGTVTLEQTDGTGRIFPWAVYLLG